MDQPDSSTANPALMEEIPQTLDELNALVAKFFHCMTGPPMSYFHIPLSPDPAYKSDPALGPPDLVERLVYVSLRYATRDTEGAEARLIQAMLEPFLDARRQIIERCKDDIALLFWRTPPQFDEFQGSRILRCRVVMPGADIRHYEVKEGDGMRWV